MAEAFYAEQRKITEIAGIEVGYRYTNSPIVWNEPVDEEDLDTALIFS